MAASTTTKRVHILTAVNAANVSRTDKGFLIRNVCGAVDDIVMNRVLYPAAELANGAHTLEDRPAPIDHPKNAAGQYISANSGDALLTAFAGAICRNARHEGGRTLHDIVIDAKRMEVHPKGSKVLDWCNAAADGKNPPPMHTSTGLIADMLDKPGESGGKAYDRVATNIRYDHDAMLPDSTGAGTPEQGVGMFNDGTDTLQEVETVVVNSETQDKRSTGFALWLNRVLFRRTVANELSFDQIRDGLWRALQATAGDGAWVLEVYDRYAIWSDREGKLWRQDYSVSSEGSVAFSGTAVEVKRQTTYEPVTNQERDPMKDKILAALNAAGVKTEGLDEAALLTAYNALVGNAAKAPVEQQLTAANTELQTLRTNAQAAEQAEVTQLATELAVNSGGMTAEDLKRLPVARLRELKAARGKTAAPLLTANAGGQPANNAAEYDTLPE